MFRTYYFCEMPYAYPPGFEFAEVTRTADVIARLPDEAETEAHPS